MPRRKAGDSIGPIHHRSRDGCLTCRSRRIKCDQGQPICSNCFRKRLQCLRQVKLKWQAEYESQGLAFGREGIWSKHSTRSRNDCQQAILQPVWVRHPNVQGHSFVYYTAEDEENGSKVVVATRDAFAATSSDLPRPLCLFPNATVSVDASILAYYVERFCPLTTITRRARSPFVDLILPSLPGCSSAVMDAVLALAACHGSNYLPHWKTLAAKLGAKATHALRLRLANMSSDQVASDAEVQIVTMMLCLYEIIGQRHTQWVIHLKGARDISRTRRGLKSSEFLPQGLLKFTDSFFAFQDVIGRTACGEKPNFDHTYWDAEDVTVDTYLGCSPALVAIVDEITQLSQRKNRLSKAEFEVRASELENKFDNLEQIVRDTLDIDLQKSAQVKYLAASVVMHCALHDASPSVHLVRQLVADILSLLKWFIARQLGAGLIWPLFVAAVELDPEDDEYFTPGSEAMRGRPLVLQALEALATTSVANTSKARQVITAVWQARDEALDEILSRIKPNDWDTFVAPRSLNISLA